MQDKDLLSIQEVRNLIAQAKEAQKQYAAFSQEQVDRIVCAMADAARANAEQLAKMAHAETGYGKWQDKTVKNLFAADVVFRSIRDMKTVGILARDDTQRTMDIAVPVGVIVGLIPSTNPTSTAIYKALISLKAGNAIVFSPHPSAGGCIGETARILAEAAARAGAPQGMIGCASILTKEGTDELMKHRDVSLILATGGEAMVRAAYSSGTPAIGVGPGNGPAFIEKSADFEKAVHDIIASKTFDNGVICASEQSIVVECESAAAVKAELNRQGAYFLSPEESKQLGLFLLRGNLTLNPQIVGKDAQALASISGLSIPMGTKVLVSEQTTVGKTNPYSREKLAPILAFYVEDDWNKACERCLELLNNEGKGHTLIIHSNNQEIIQEFALKKCVSRVLVNTPGALGGIGATTNLRPALTLGCGAVGGSSTSENIGPQHLINIRKLAYGVRTAEEVTAAALQTLPVSVCTRSTDGGNCQKTSADRSMSSLSEYELTLIVEEILKQVL